MANLQLADIACKIVIIVWSLEALIVLMRSLHVKVKLVMIDNFLNALFV